MTTFRRLAPLVGAAFVLSLGLAACGEATEQQSSAPQSEQSSDAAAVPESTTEATTEQSQ